MALSAILGQDRAVAILRAGLAAGRLPSYLFIGPRGVGKRTTALALAQALICPSGDAPHEDCPVCRQVQQLTHPDLRVYFPQRAFDKEKEREEDRDYAERLPTFAAGVPAPPIAPEHRIKIRRIREIRAEMRYAPTSGRHRVTIILNADQMTEEASNAFLKTLEEPQRASVFILTTHRPLALLPTIRSRCQAVTFTRLRREVILDYLVAHTTFPRPQLEFAATVAEGSLAEALVCAAAPDQYFSKPALELFCHPPDSDIDRLQLIGPLDRGDAFAFVFSLLALYRQALHRKLGLPLTFPQLSSEIGRQADRLSEEELTVNIERLLRGLDRTGGYPNPRLFFFDLVAGLG